MRTKTSKILALGLSTCFLVALSGCKLFDKTEEQGEGGKTAKKEGSLLKFVKQKVAAESFFSIDTPMVLLFDQTVDEQKNNLDALLSSFAVLPGGKTFKEAITSKLDEFGFSFDEEIKPILGDKVRVAISFEKLFGEEKKGLILASKISDQKKYDDFSTKILEKENVQEEDYENSKIIFSEGSELDFSFTSYENFLVFADNKDSLKESIKKAKIGKEILSESKDYLNSIKNFEDNFLVFYMSPQKLYELGKDKTNTAPIKQNEDYSKMTKSLALALSAEKDGISISGNAFADVAIISKLKMGFDVIPDSENYLFKKTPGKGTIFYIEGSNLKKKIELLLESFSENKEEAEISMKTFSTMLNMQADIDLEKEILSWFDKGFSLEIGSSMPNILPAITALVDAKSDPKGAKQFVTKMKKSLETIASIFNAKGANPAAIEPTSTEEESSEDALKKLEESYKTENKVIEVLDKKEGGLSFTVLKISLDKIPSMSLLKVPPENIEVSFGVTDDNMFFISTLSDFAQQQGSSNMDKNKLFSNLIKKLPEKNTGIFYFETKGVLSYFDIILNIAKTTAGISNDQVENFENFKNYISKLKGGVLSSKNSKKESEITGFISIESDAK